MAERHQGKMKKKKNKKTEVIIHIFYSTSFSIKISFHPSTCKHLCLIIFCFESFVFTIVVIIVIIRGKQNKYFKLNLMGEEDEEGRKKEWKQYIEELARDRVIEFNAP